MKKTGLVVEGGGMKCAYSAGVLDAFLENRITFDYCIGASAGAASAASYVAGQHGRNLRFYTEHTKEPLYFGLRSFLKTGDLFNLKYIFTVISRIRTGEIHWIWTRSCGARQSMNLWRPGRRPGSPYTFQNMI